MGSVMSILQRYSQYATKADFKVLSHEVKTHISHLEEKTDRLEKKTDRLEEATVHLNARTGRLEEKVDHLDQKLTQFEARISSELADLKSTMNTNMDQCKTEFGDNSLGGQGKTTTFFMVIFLSY